MIHTQRIQASLLLCMVATAATADIGPGMSPIVTWDPDRGMISRPPTKRPLTATETGQARARADAFWTAYARTRAFSQPGDLSTHLDSWAVVNDAGLIEQSLTAYWSRPFDTRRHKDGAWYGAMGGAHYLMYLYTNFGLPAHYVEDADTRGNFGRDAPDGTRYFAQPRQFGEIGGGTLYADTIVFTRDGRSALAPAPLGTLLDIEADRLKKWIADQDKHAGQALLQLEASMTPEAIAQRRAKRESIWARETRDPAALAKRLDAAHKTDEWDTQRQRERLAPGSGSRDPTSTYWAPRLALEKVEAQRNALTDRATPACGRVDPEFGHQTGFNVRYEAVGAPGCIPMMQVRKDLLDRRRPPGEVQMFIIRFPGHLCGEWWGSGQPRSRGDPCARFVPTLKELDWPALRAALGWRADAPAP